MQLKIMFSDPYDISIDIKNAFAENAAIKYGKSV